MDHHPHAARALHQERLSEIRVYDWLREDIVLQRMGQVLACAACPGKLNKQKPAQDIAKCFMYTP